MDDDRTFDRRSFLRRTSATSLFGLSGIGPLALHTGRESDEPDGRTGGDDGDRDRSRQDGEVDFFQAVLPVGDVLEADLVYRIVVVGGPIQPGVRPPPLCFPQGDEQWIARDAVVVKPTETSGLFGSDEEIGAVERTRVHLERPVEPGTVYRISGGEYCDGYARVTVHELPPRLSEYFSVEMIDRLDESLRGVGNETAGNGTAGNETVGNGTAGNGTAENRTRGGPTVGTDSE